MAQEQDKKHRLDPDPPLTPDFPRLRHPDLDLDKTEDVEEAPNRDEVEVPRHEDVQPGHPAPEPPD